MWTCLFIALLSFYPVEEPVSGNDFTQLQKEEPPYAKWGRIAMTETKKRYPEADIVDYLHIGAIEENGITVEKFKLWLRGEDREFGVFIDIHFRTDTEEIIEMTFEETDR